MKIYMLIFRQQPSHPAGLLLATIAFVAFMDVQTE